MSCDIIAQIADALDRMSAEGRKPARLLLGHREAAEVEMALHRPPLFSRGMSGEIVVLDEGFEPTLPYPLTQRCTIWDVEVQRVDQDTLLGVIAEGYEA